MLRLIIMELSFTVDLDAEEIHIVVDNMSTLKAYKNTDNKIMYKNFDKLDTDDLQDKVKEICIILFSCGE
jgi:hypothetical protein